jgi:hypothetical protein
MTAPVDINLQPELFFPEVETKFKGLIYLRSIYGAGLSIVRRLLPDTCAFRAEAWQ